MANDWFQFKRFLVRQDRCAMKVGTDGVLLGTWASFEGGLPLLDIGSGTGLVALIAAQRMETAMRNARCDSKFITAVELDADASDQANGNFSDSPWSEFMECVCCDVKNFDSNKKFGTILCNPPYFRNSLRCPDASRNGARHGDSLSFEDLACCVSRLLNPDGLFAVVIPYDAVSTFVRAFALEGLYPVRQTDVCTKSGVFPKRSLLEFSFTPSNLKYNCFPLVDNNGCETDEYVQLVRDFYLKF